MTVEEVRKKYGAVNAADIVENGDPLTFAMSVEGLEGTGKTWFALQTCPRPICHVNFGDRDATSQIYEMSEGRRKDTTLYALHSESPGGWTLEEGRQSLVTLSDIAKKEIGDGKLKGGTFVIDSGSTWWSVIRKVHVVPKQEARRSSGGKEMGGLEYEGANLIVSGVLSWIKNQGVFLVMTHTKTTVWDREGPIDGKYKPQLCGRVPYLVEVQIDLTKQCADEKCGAPDCRRHTGRRHFGQFVKFGRDTAVEGMRLEGLKFETVYAMYAKSKFPNPEALT